MAIGVLPGKERGAAFLCCCMLCTAPRRTCDQTSVTYFPRPLAVTQVLAALRDEQRDRHNHQTAPEAVAFHGGRDAEDAPGT